jgi:DNA-binding transcriptional LysR family regulator
MPEQENTATAARQKEMPPFAALQAFEAVFRLGGIRKAAQALGVSHSVVSRHLKALEAWIGAPLSVRSGNALSLTHVGRAYHERVSAALSEIAVATREAIGDAPQRRLRVWCMSAFVIQWLAAELPELERGFPDITVEVRPTDAPANLRVHEADVNVHFYCDPDLPGVGAPGVKIQELIRPEMLIVASPDLARDIGAIASPAEILSLPLLHGGGVAQEWPAWLLAQGVTPPADFPGVYCWSEQMALAAARLGRGLLVASRFVVHQDLTRGELVEISPPTGRRVAIGAYVFMAREDRWTSPPIVRLRNALRERMLAFSGD